MLKSIKAIFENATEKDIANVEFQRYIRLMTRSDKYKCCNCGEIKEGRYLGIKSWYCYKCILDFNSE